MEGDRDGRGGEGERRGKGREGREGGLCSSDISLKNPAFCHNFYILLGSVDIVFRRDGKYL